MKNIKLILILLDCLKYYSSSIILYLYYIIKMFLHLLKLHEFYISIIKFVSYFVLNNTVNYNYCIKLIYYLKKLLILPNKHFKHYITNKTHAIFILYPQNFIVKRFCKGFNRSHTSRFILLFLILLCIYLSLIKSNLYSIILSHITLHPNFFWCFDYG